MKPLDPDDVSFVLSRAPRDVVVLMQKKGVILGGGFIRSVLGGENINDIDLFGADQTMHKENAINFAASRAGARTHTTDNACTIIQPPRHPVQFILRWVYDTPEKVVESFDFTVCCAAIWWRNAGTGPEPQPEGWYSACHDRFYMDLAAKRLIYTAPDRNEMAGGSILRMRKFIGRGYSIQPMSMAMLIVRLLRGVPKDAPFWTGDDTVRSMALISLLRDVDPLVPIDGGTDMIDDHV